MSDIERQTIINYISALNIEEKKLVADCLPIEICFNRVGNYLKDLRELEHGLFELASEHIDRRMLNGRHE